MVKGLVLLLISLVFEAVRLTLTQQMIQSSGLRLEARGSGAVPEGYDTGWTISPLPRFPPPSVPPSSLGYR